LVTETGEVFVEFPELSHAVAVITWEPDAAFLAFHE
jgi:hypothetical protein